MREDVCTQSDSLIFVRYVPGTMCIHGGQSKTKIYICSTGANVEVQVLVDLRGLSASVCTFPFAGKTAT